MAEVRYTRLSLSDNPELISISESSNEMEIARSRRAVSKYLSERAQELLAWVTTISIAPLQSIIQLGRHLGPAVVYENEAASFNTIVECALEDTHRFQHENSPHTIEELFVKQFVRQLHLLFNMKVGTLLRNAKNSRTKLWDCTESSLPQWLKEAKMKSTLVTHINTTWTSISRYDAGLLVVRHIIAEPLLKRVYANCSKHSPVTYDDSITPNKQRLRLAKTPSRSLRNQLKIVELVDPSIYDIAIRFYSFFSNLIKNEEGACFVEVELTKALSSWYAAYKMHGLSMANTRFCSSISNSTLFSYRLKLSAADEDWTWSKGSIPSWLAKNAGSEEIRISVLPKPKGIPSKQKLIVSHLAFKRQDLVVWRVPMPGKEVGHFWGDFAYD